MDDQAKHLQYCYVNTDKRNALWLEVAARGWLAGTIDFPHAKATEELLPAMVDDAKAILAEICCGDDEVAITEQFQAVWAVAYRLSTLGDEERDFTRLKFALKPLDRAEALRLLRSYFAEQAPGRRGFAQILKMAQIIA